MNRHSDLRVTASTGLGGANAQLSSSARTPEYERAVADTSYLLPFGVAGYRKLLQLLHPRAVRSPSSVRVELQRIAHRSGDQLRKQAAEALLARNTPVQYEEVSSEDNDFREDLLDDLHQHAVDAGRASGARPPRSDVNLGEADCMCLCRRGTEPMRCNDSGARRVAARRGLRSRSTAQDLANLLEQDFTANQLTEIARRMQPLDIGDVVSGPGYFRRPTRP